MKSLCLMVAVFLAMPVFAGPGDRVSIRERIENIMAGGQTRCDRTAKSALKACKHDVQDDYFTQVGNCVQIASSELEQECRIEAEEIRAEDSVLCTEVFEARRDLCDALNEDFYDPDLDPANFVTPAEAAINPNPYFPLVPGNTSVLESPDGEVITVVVLEDTIEIAGVECTIVRDIVTDEEGELIEDTDDFYAQDIDGNVWYFGEISKNYEDGRLVDLDGSWISGTDFAKAGILMQANPIPGQIYRQEFLLREAEDVGEVIALGVSATSPAVNCVGDCLQTFDFTPLEADALEHKFFAPGVGVILEIDLESGERTELVSFTPGTP